MLKVIDSLKFIKDCKYKTIMRFGITGFVNTGVDFGVFTIISIVSPLKIEVCQFISYSAGLINSFIMNKFWTFEDSSRAKLTNTFLFLKFIIINLLSLSISIGGIKILFAYLGVNAFIAKILVTMVVQVINYLGYKLWVFNKTMPNSSTKFKG